MKKKFSFFFYKRPKTIHLVHWTIFFCLFFSFHIIIISSQNFDIIMRLSFCFCSCSCFVTTTTAIIIIIIKFDLNREQKQNQVTVGWKSVANGIHKVCLSVCVCVRSSTKEFSCFIFGSKIFFFFFRSFGWLSIYSSLCHDVCVCVYPFGYRMMVMMAIYMILEHILSFL